MCYYRMFTVSGIHSMCNPEHKHCVHSNWPSPSDSDASTPGVLPLLATLEVPSWAHKYNWWTEILNPVLGSPALKLMGDQDPCRETVLTPRHLVQE